MTDARGKLGGQVFTKTRSGATIRTKVTPTNPQTSAQQTSRSILGTLSTKWRSLDQADRASWNSAVDGFAKTNIFGDSYLPSGKNLYVGLNANLLSVNLVASDVAPVPVSTPAAILTNVFIDTGAEEIILSFAAPLPGLNYSVVYQATKPSSAGRYNFSGQYVTFLATSAAAVTSDSAMWVAYVDKFGAPVIGQKVSFRVFIIVNATGQKSVESVASNVAE